MSVHEIVGNSLVEKLEGELGEAKAKLSEDFDSSCLCYRDIEESKASFSSLQDILNNYKGNIGEFKVNLDVSRWPHTINYLKEIEDLCSSSYDIIDKIIKDLKELSINIYDEGKGKFLLEESRIRARIGEVRQKEGTYIRFWDKYYYYRDNNDEKDQALKKIYNYNDLISLEYELDDLARQVKNQIEDLGKDYLDANPNGYELAKK